MTYGVGIMISLILPIAGCDEGSFETSALGDRCSLHYDSAHHV